MGQGKNKDAAKSVDFHVHLDYTDDVSRLHYCEHCEKFELLEKFENEHLCPICGLKMHKISNNGLVSLTTTLVYSILKKYLYALSKHWEGYILFFLHRDLYKLLGGLLGIRKKDIKIDVQIPKPSFIKRLKKEFVGMITRTYNWTFISINIELPSIIMSYNFSNTSDGWECKIELEEK